MNTLRHQTSHLERPVRIEHRGMVVQMMYNEFKDLVKMFGCELSYDNTIIFGPNQILEVSVDSLH